MVGYSLMELSCPCRTSSGSRKTQFHARKRDRSLMARSVDNATNTRDQSPPFNSDAKQRNKTYPVVAGGATLIMSLFLPTGSNARLSGKVC